jgi:hypothetical protein
MGQGVMCEHEPTGAGLAGFCLRWLVATFADRDLVFQD